MKPRWVAGFAPLVVDEEASYQLYAEQIGLALPSGDYIGSDDISGTKHFALWRLSEAAQSCFGLPEWPSDVPQPQATIEFDYVSHEAAVTATDELEAAGHTLIHPARIEPWGQTVARLISPEGLLIGISHTPWQRQIQPLEGIGFLRTLRAVRSFTDQPVPATAIQDILKVAQWSGSSMNRQPWNLIVIQDPATMEALAAISSHAGHFRGASLVIILVMDGERPASEGFDEGRLAERIMLAAHALGLGSCIGEFDEGEDADKVRHLLKIPAEKSARIGISIGFAAPEAEGARARRAQPRKELNAIVHAGTYDTDAGDLLNTVK